MLVNYLWGGEVWSNSFQFRNTSGNIINVRSCPEISKFNPSSTLQHQDILSYKRQQTGKNEKMPVSQSLLGEFYVVSNSPKNYRQSKILIFSNLQYTSCNLQIVQGDIYL